MPRTDDIRLGDGTMLPILHEDRSVLAIDKPPGWMLVPYSWQKTDKNLLAAITSSIQRGDFWARSRNLRFLRNIHRLDAETSGVLLLAKSLGAVNSLSRLFGSRRIEKRYLAVVTGEPPQTSWSCHRKLAPDPSRIGRMKIDARQGKPAETVFQVLRSERGLALIEARPVTGRTHQIRLHLASCGLPVLGDCLYGGAPPASELSSNRLRLFPLALRAIEVSYRDPFTRKSVRIAAPSEAFLDAMGFSDGSGG